VNSNVLLFPFHLYLHMHASFAFFLPFLLGIVECSSGLGSVLYHVPISHVSKLSYFLESNRSILLCSCGFL
jgi:hypothetical protein